MVFGWRNDGPNIRENDEKSDGVTNTILKGQFNIFPPDDHFLNVWLKYPLIWGIQI